MTEGLNRWIVRHPLRAPIIGFAATGALAVISLITGRPLGIAMRFVVLLGLVSLMLLVYGLVIKALVRRGRGEERPRPPEEVSVDERARREAVARWKRRARQDRGY